jgi:hypothetical protein
MPSICNTTRRRRLRFHGTLVPRRIIVATRFDDRTFAIRAGTTLPPAPPRSPRHMPWSPEEDLVTHPAPAGVNVQSFPFPVATPLWCCWGHPTTGTALSPCTRWCPSHQRVHAHERVGMCWLNVQILPSCDRCVGQCVLERAKYGGHSMTVVHQREEGFSRYA